MAAPGVIPIPGLPISGNAPQQLQLKSGQIVTIPPGDFLFKLSGQTAIQWNDANSGQWHVYEAGPSNHPIPVQNSDGTNFRLINLSGTISGMNITNAGTAYSSGTTVAFGAPASGITATANLIIGGSLSFSIPAGSTGGTGYTNPILLVPPPQLLGGTFGLCLPATATLGISSGVINSETAGFSGAGYVTAPGNATQTITPAQFSASPNQYFNSTNMIIIDPAGSGATIAATVGGAGTVTGYVMTNPGSGYDGTHIPTVTFTDPLGLGSSAAATALPNLALTGVTIGSTNTGYTASVLGITSLGSGAANEIGINGEQILARQASFTCTESGGALQTAVIEDAGIGFQTVPLAKQVGNATADGSVNATFTAVVGGVTNTVTFWQVG